MHPRDLKRTTPVENWLKARKLGRPCPHSDTEVLTDLIANNPGLSGAVLESLYNSLTDDLRYP